MGVRATDPTSNQKGTEVMNTKKKTAKKTARRSPAARPMKAEAALAGIAQSLAALVGLTDAPAIETARKINARLAKDATGLWTTGDGSRVPVANMPDQHLFYALAKARRGEYPDTYSRKVEVAVLESEVLRRLIKGVK
jgi:hypothetical protein